jgi:ATP-dependent Clp protease ATP-binding subunit ClpA
MLIGLAGCGKTQIIKGMLDDLTTGNNAEYTQ